MLETYYFHFRVVPTMGSGYLTTMHVNTCGSVPSSTTPFTGTARDKVFAIPGKDSLTLYDEAVTVCILWGEGSTKEGPEFPFQ